MKKSILEIYALAVCFVTVVCGVVALGIAGYSIIEISKPDFTINSEQYSRFQNNDDFWSGCGEARFCSDEIRKQRPSEAELTKRRGVAFEQVLFRERRDGSQSLAKCLIILLIDALVFSAHWALARRARL